MGFRPSPYNACRSFLWAEEIIRGNPRDVSLPFQYDRIELNMPGEVDYCPDKPWLMKTRADGKIASDVVTYIDDLRTIGSSEELCQEVTRRVASVVNYLGMQDAPRKRRPASKTPGAWAGSVVSVHEDGVYVSVSQERWDKTRRILLDLEEGLERELPQFSHKQLLSDRGFLIYVARTYPTMAPYLKGLHLTIEHWRDNRDEQGWPVDRITRKKRRRTDEEILEDFEEQLGAAPAFADLREAADESPPQQVSPVPRLHSDVRCLLELFEEETPAVRCVRGGSYAAVVYGCGDASGSGFGSAFVTGVDNNEFDKFDDEISYRIGVWGSDSDDVTSNFRELRNVVESIEDQVEKGKLKNAELFMFTDNSTAESAFYRGTSSNKDLFELVLRLKKLEMTAGLKIHLIHIAGRRMIADGVDGLSRGCLTEGVMAGVPFLDFFPLNETAFDRSPWLLEDFSRMIPFEGLTLLEPKDWFEKGHDIHGWHMNKKDFWYPILKAGTYIWQPAPAVAKYAVEELRKARLKRQDSCHIFVCPRIFTTKWRKQLYKVADLVFEISCGALPSWDVSQCEPLVVGIVFPFLIHRPWQLRNTPKLLAVVRKLRTMWKESPSDAGNFLCKFCKYTRALGTLSKGVVWELLQTSHPGLFSGIRATRRRRFRLDEERRRQKIPGWPERRQLNHALPVRPLRVQEHTKEKSS
jgi:hypothetical protein